MTLATSDRAGLPRRWWPLAVSLAVHTLLIVLWVRHADLRPVAVETPEPLSVMLLPTRPAPAPVPKRPETTPDKRKDGRPREAIAPAALTPAAKAAPLPPPAAPTEVQAQTPANPTAARILEESRYDIGKMLRAQDGVAPLHARPTPQQLTPSGKWSRFAQQVEDAHIDQAPGFVTEEYTAPDGRILYRRREGGKVICRQSGSTGPPTPWRSEEAVRAGAGRKSTLGVGSSAGDVLCPKSDRDWKKY